MSNRKKSHHVVHNQEGGWDVKKSGSSKSSGHSRHESREYKILLLNFILSEGRNPECLEQEYRIFEINPEK